MSNSLKPRLCQNDCFFFQFGKGSSYQHILAQDKPPTYCSICHHSLRSKCCWNDSLFQLYLQNVLQFFPSDVYFQLRNCQIVQFSLVFCVWAAAFAPMRGEVSSNFRDMNSRRQPFDSQRYFSESDREWRIGGNHLLGVFKRAERVFYFWEVWVELLN